MLASIAASPRNRTPADAAVGRSAPGQVTGRLKVAMDAMIWHGLTRCEAAAKANMTEHSLYVALRRPHVKAYYLAELDVLRTSERARNIHALVEVRDDKSNKMARVQAVRTLEGMSDDTPAGRPGGAQVAGFVVIVREGSVAQAASVTIDHSAPDIRTEISEQDQ